MKRLVLLAALVVTVNSAMAQEDGFYKNLMAKSVLNEKAPELVVEKWLGDEPDTEGKFILIDFWATTCGPCRKGIPYMNELAKKFKEDVVVIGISNESEERIRAMTDPVIEFYNASDTNDIMAGALEIKAIPYVLLIDPEGIVRWEGFPYAKGHELTEEVITGIIKKYKK